MPEFDLLIIGTHPHPVIGIAEGRIAALREGSAKETIRAEGRLVLPGVVDAHVHFNDPGRADWEGWPTGSRAALAGGVTTVCDMPLNSTPPVVTAAAFDAKRAAGEAGSCCDFALWGGLVPGHLDDLEPLAERGVMGFKAFMSGSGIDDFPKADLATLREGMKRAAALGLPVGVHAEFDETEPAGGTSVREYLASRPIESECAAIKAAIEIAGETKCALQVVHVSSAQGLALIASARLRGVNVTAETCPHYLLLTGEDMERIGPAAKCAPPMRDAANRETLWRKLRAGDIQTIGSDHSPSPWSMKLDPNFFKVWGGISSIQHLLPLLLDADLEPERVAVLTATNPARRFRLPAKGEIAVGSDADLTLVETGVRDPITADSLFYHHRHSPYVGRTLSARVERTILRGQTAYLNGTIPANGPRGQLLKPL